MTDTSTEIRSDRGQPRPLGEMSGGRSGGTGGGMLAGAIGAAAALGVGELASGLSKQVPSLVVAVGEFLIDTTPGAIARFTIDLFGTAQKTILVWGITIVSLLVGALVGRAATKKLAVGPASATALVVSVFSLFAIVGALAGSRLAQTSTVGVWLTAIVAGVVGSIATLALARLAQRQPSPIASSAAAVDPSTESRLEPATDRRRFLNLAVGVAAAAGGATFVGRWLRSRFAVEDARALAATQVAESRQDAAAAAEVADAAAGSSGSGDTSDTAADADAPAATMPETGALPVGLEAEIDGIAPLVVPNDDFYRIDTALVVPQIDPADWSMRITGMVDNEITLTFDDLLARALVEEPVTLSCVSNDVGGNLVGNAMWLGVPLRELLEEAGVQPGGTQIVGRSVDGWTGGFPTAHLDNPEVVAMVAVGMNGEPLPVSHGFPARLVIAGLYGYVSATKWLAEIEITSLEAFDGYWIPRGWSKLGPVKTQSRIDVPKRADRGALAPGRQPIAGVAWAPTRSISRVEVQVDDGEWVDADLADELSTSSWRQWSLPWDAQPGPHIIAVRATDGDGVTQPAQRTSPAPNGADGHHTIRVQVNTA